ncbi:MAG: hypothetical protein NT075_07595 [Chloroflexi bacterium]|nr:hypothetical protein [Chloroflexota bacterium]
MFTYEYDFTYAGPALPIIDITVLSLRNNSSIMRRALVDSGADATILTLRDLNYLKARKVDTMQMRGISGFSQSVDIYTVSLQIGFFKLPKVYAVADRQNGETIVGRDVLNQFIVTLNGLAVS